MQSGGNSEFISDWISGSPEELDIASVYDFEPEQEYTVELDVINSLNPLPHTYSEDIVIETCHQQIRNISFDVNNPAENFLQLDVTLQDPETISVFLACVYSGHTQRVLQDVELEPGKWNFSEDISQLVPGIYALTIVSETDVLTKTVVKP